MAPVATSSHADPAAWHIAVILGAALVGATWFLIAENGIAGQWGYSLDDSWIYATYARNLATGHGYSFNPGEHIGGATGPLYVFLLAALYSIFRDVVLPAKALGILCLGAASLVTYFTMKRMDPTGAVKRLLAGVLMAISPVLIWGSVAGLELPLYLLAACLGFYFYVRGQGTLAVLAWSIGIWLRPDGLFLVAAGLLLWRGGGLRSAWKPALVALVILGAYFAFNEAVGGRLFPTSVGVKTHIGGDLLGRERRIVGQWLDLWGVPHRAGRFEGDAVFLLPALIVGVVRTWRRWPLLVVYLVTFPVVFALVGQPTGQYGRYIVYVVPIGILLGLEGFETFARRAFPRTRQAAFVAMGVLCVVWQIGSGWILGISHGWNVRNINGMHRYIGETMRKANSPGDTIAVNDVGAMGYFSDCYIVDLVGLVSPPRPFPENLRHYRPKAMIIFPDWFQQYAAIDPQTNQVVFYDADSTYKWSPIIGVGLTRNTIVARNTLYIYERLRRDEEGARDVKMIIH